MILYKMNLKDRIELLTKAGEYFGTIVDASANEQNNTTLHEELQLIQSHQKYNGWFTSANIIHALKSWNRQLTEGNLQKWTRDRQFAQAKKDIGIVMAGNIPLVGFHDFVCVFISGHKAKIKLSSQDNLLLPGLISYLTGIYGQLSDYVEFVDVINDVDAVIATGSNNTSRYFEQYFGNMPNIIRKNRTSVAVLDGRESEEEMLGLADDLLLYFGLGCRNISKLYVPRNYDLNKVFGAVYQSYEDIISHNKYANNYDYHKAIYMLSKLSFLENGMMILKEDESLFSPVSVVNYEYYQDLTEVKKTLNMHKDQLQCVVSNHSVWDDKVALGQTQLPKLWDYADNIDTLDFLREL